MARLTVPCYSPLSVGQSPNQRRAAATQLLQFSMQNGTASRSLGGRDLANPKPKPFVSPAGREPLHICSFHSNYRNLHPFIAFFSLFSKMEQSHSLFRKIKPGIRECADRAMNCLILDSERPREKTFDVGRMGTELDKKHARTGWPTNQVVFRDYKQ